MRRRSDLFTYCIAVHLALVVMLAACGSIEPLRPPVDASEDPKSDAPADGDTAPDVSTDDGSTGDSRDAGGAGGNSGGGNTGGAAGRGGASGAAGGSDASGDAGEAAGGGAGGTADVGSPNPDATDAGATDIGGNDTSGTGDSRSGTDSGSPDADGGPKCNLASPFGLRTAVPGLSIVGHEVGLSLSPDGLTAYFSSNRNGGVGRIFVATRTAADLAFGPATLLTSIVSAPRPDGGSVSDWIPRISTDGLRLYFHSDRNATGDIFLATRNSLVVDFGTPQALAVINTTTFDEFDAYLTADETTIVFGSSAPGSLDLYLADKAPSGMFNTPAPIPGVSSSADEYQPLLTNDKLTLYFSSFRTDPPAQGGADIWVARRSTINDGFGAPQNVAELNTAQYDYSAGLSADGCTLYISSGPAGALRFYQATRGP